MPEGLKNTFQVPLADALATVEKSIGRDIEGRIIQPFETAVDKRSITEVVLERYASLKVECYLFHNKDGVMVLSTGSPDSTQYDFGPEIEKLGKDRDHVLDTFGYEDYEDILRFSPLHAIKRAQKLRKENILSEQSYITHQHPSGKLSLSPGDLRASSLNGAEIDMVFTKDGVLFYKVSPGQFQRLHEWAEENCEASSDDFQKGYEQFISDEGIIQKAVMFGTPEMSDVVRFMRGEMTWDEIRK